MRRWAFGLALAACLGIQSAAAMVPVLADVHELYTNGRLQEAERRLHALRDALDPREDKYPDIMAFIYWQEAQISAARGDFERAIAQATASMEIAGQVSEQAGPLTAIYQGERGKIRMKAGIMHRAREDLAAATEALSRDSRYEGLRRDMRRHEAIALSELGDVAAAKEHFAALVLLARAQGSNEALAQALIDLAGTILRDGTRGLASAGEAEKLAAEAEALIPPANATLRGEALVLQGRIALQRSDLARAAGFFSTAETLFRDPTRLAHARLLRGEVHLLRGEAAEAEGLFRAAVQDIRADLGQTHPVLARTLVGLGLVTAELGRLTEAIDYLRQAIRVFEDSTYYRPVPAAEARVELAMIFTAVEEYENARVQAETALEALSSGQSDLRRAYAHSAVGFALAGLGETAAATGHLRRALDEMARLRGAQSADLAPGLIRLAELTGKEGDPEEARALLDRAFHLLEKEAASGPRLMATARAADLTLLVAQGDTDRAAARARDAIAKLAADLRPAPERCDPRPLDVSARHRLLTVAIDALAQVLPPSTARDAELFAAAQIAHAGVTARTILRQSRVEAGPAAERPLHRARARLAAERCALDREVLHGISGLTEAETIDRLALEARLQEMTDEIASLDARLGAGAGPDSDGPPLTSAEELQRHLAPGEAMLLQVTGDTTTHLFWIDGTGLSHAQTGLGKLAAHELVEELRDSIAITYVKEGQPLPSVPLTAAYSLYQAIFEPFRTRMQDARTVFFVADGALRALPPAMLLASPPDTPAEADPDALAGLDWLGAQAAISVTPSPAAHVALRDTPARPAASLGFLGIGNPTFAKPRDALPDTADELRALAAHLPGTTRLITEGDATERHIRSSEDVRQARVIAFATHGLLNREQGVTEPALRLASPASPDAQDDGFLTASEIAQLDLRADWVILSACNTAAGRDDRAEGLSGLASGFFAAGAQSLLVSHWYVPSSAASALTVFTAQALAEPGTTRAEALRRAMDRVRAGEALDGARNPRFGHPAYWAPFVVVGKLR